MKDLPAATLGALLSAMLASVAALGQPPGRPEGAIVIELPEDAEVLEVLRAALDDPATPLPPVRAVTRGPQAHWFGYYDKLQIDPAGRYVLAMAVDFEHRSPTADDVVEVGMVDLADGDRWIPLGTCRAWNWQQGCMLQWRPGSATQVLWNDRRDGRFVCVLHDVRTGEERILPRPAYHVSPDGRQAVGLDFARVNDMRPGYGYAGIPDANRAVPAPADSGIYRMDLDTGAVAPLLSIAELAGRLGEGESQPTDRHWVNHLQWNTDGTRLLFLHRWRPASGTTDPAVGGFQTRAWSVRADGGDLRPLTPSASHTTWRSPSEALIWTDGAYRLFRDDGSRQARVVLRAPDGHPSYVPGTRWIVGDTYPFAGYGRMQYLFLWHESGRRVIPLGRFHSPQPYQGEWRCDLHARVSADGRFLLFDSTHGGGGRQVYLVELRGLPLDD